MSLLSALQLQITAAGRRKQNTDFNGLYRVIRVSTWIISVVAISCRGPSIELKIPKTNIEQELRTKFPTARPLGKLAEITLQDPELILGKHKKRLTVVLDAAVTPRSLRAVEITRGTIELSSTLAFHRKSAQILLKNVSIDSISFTRISREDLNSEIARALRMLAEEELEGMPVYVLEPGTPRRVIAGMFLRKLTIQKDGILVTLGL